MKTLIGSQQLRQLVATLNAFTIPTGQRYVNNLPVTRLGQDSNPNAPIDSVQH